VSSEHDAAVRVVREVLAPLIRSDGGKVYLIAGTGDAVRIHLAGRYSGCPGNTLARRRVIEPALLAVAPGLEIIITSGALVPPDAELLELPPKRS